MRSVPRDMMRPAPAGPAGPPGSRRRPVAGGGATRAHGDADAMPRWRRQGRSPLSPIIITLRLGFPACTTATCSPGCTPPPRHRGRAPARPPMRRRLGIARQQHDPPDPGAAHVGQHGRGVRADRVSKTSTPPPRHRLPQQRPARPGESVGGATGAGPSIVPATAPARCRSPRGARRPARRCFRRRLMHQDRGQRGRTRSPYRPARPPAHAARPVQRGSKAQQFLPPCHSGRIAAAQPRALDGQRRSCAPSSSTACHRPSARRRHQHPGPGAARQPHDDRDRHGEDQRAGRRHHQHSQAAHRVALSRTCAPPASSTVKPRNQTDQRSASCAIRRSAALRGLHQADNAGIVPGGASPAGRRPRH